jgi:hypothetical protein
MLKSPPLPDLLANKRKRAELQALCLADPAIQEGILARIKGDLTKPETIVEGFFFWAEHYGYTFNGQVQGVKKEEVLVCYDFQHEMAEVLVLEICNALINPLYRWNGGADKARYMTATYTSLLVIQYFAQFHGVTSVISSKDADSVDIPGNMDSPFEKLRWQIEQQLRDAPWLFPKLFNWYDKEHNKKKLINFQNGGQISGLAPTGKAMRQGRGLIWLADEFAFVEDDRPCWDASAGMVRIRIMMTTPSNPYCKAYEVIHGKEDQEPEEREQFHCFELDWWRHPVMAQGLYKKPDGSYSSPAFDEILRTNNRQLVAREYLRDWSESVGGYIFHMFRREESVRPKLEPADKIMYRAWDTGGTMAVCYGQPDRYGRLLFLKEIAMSREKVARHTTLLKACAERALSWADTYYSHLEIVDIGDPYGSKAQLAMQSKDETEYELLFRLYGIRVQSSFMYKIANRRERRIEVLSNLMTEDVELEDGSMSPRLLVDAANCPLTIAALKGKYRRPIDERGETVPDQVIKAHPYIDVMDGFGMIALKVFDKEGQQSDGKIKIKKKERTRWRPTGRDYGRSYINYG